MTKSISQTEHPLDENKTTAIIYSISDLGDYLVEIRHQNQKYYIGKEQQPERFGNLGQAKAKAAAREHNAMQGFLALSKTYQETESGEITQPNDENKFDYLPISI